MIHIGRWLRATPHLPWGAGLRKSELNVSYLLEGAGVVATTGPALPCPLYPSISQGPPCSQGGFQSMLSLSPLKALSDPVKYSAWHIVGAQ